MTIEEGLRIGEWELVRRINEGGMGQVWQARRPLDTGGGDRRVAAIKMLLPSGVLDPKYRKALFTEAGIQSQLQHPNIPKVIDAGTHEGLPYLVMDLISGQDLSQVLSKLRDNGRKIPWEIAAHIVREIAYGLEHAHTFSIDGKCQNVIHRDVAPKNIMISGEGAVYVLDFGVAQATSHRTSGHGVKGTVLYMAKEHALGFPTPKSDAFGLGTILWEMLENRVFRGQVDVKDIRRVVNDGWVPPLTRTDIPDALVFVLEGLLREDERKRLSISEALEVLEGAIFPARRRALAAVMRSCFGAAVMRSGQTEHELVISEDLGRALAAGKVAEAQPMIEPPKDWAEESFTRAGVPPLVPASKTWQSPRPAAVDHQEDSAPRELQSTAPLATAESGPRVAATEILEPMQVAEEGAQTTVTDRLDPPTRDRPPRLAKATHEDPRPPSKPVVEPALVPAEGEARRRRRFRFGVLWLAAAGFGAVVGLTIWFAGGAESGGAPASAPLPESAHVASPAKTSAPPKEEVEPLVIEETPPEVAVTAPEIGASQVQPPMATEPASRPKIEPAEIEPGPARPAREPKPSKPKPALVRSTINIALGFVDEMEFSLGGKKRLLREAGPTRATIKVAPGILKMRWRKPGEAWHSKRVPIKEGTDYKVNLGSLGPTIDPIRGAGR